MAIPFARSQPMHLTPASGATRILAYFARTAIYDQRVQVNFDYTALQADLVHQEIVLPEGYPKALRNLANLARTLDQAEFARVRMPLRLRKRLPLVGLALVVALPPDDEVSLREAVEILQRIVATARGSLRIPIHIAIHDPALVRAGDINRHGHALFGMRVFGPGDEVGPKLRHALVTHRASSHRPQASKIVEGISWPSVAWETQQSFFTEIGIDLVVDPIAPHPGQHLLPVNYTNGSIHTDETKHAIKEAHESLSDMNIRSLAESPSKLIQTMLRGRSALRITEIERICARFIDHKLHQEENVERILADQNVITLSDTAAATKPRYATNRQTYRLFTRAGAIVDRARDEQVKVISGADHRSVVDRISASCALLNVKGDTPLILGHSLSHCTEAATAMKSLNPLVGTIAMVITGSADLRAIGRKQDLHLRPGGLVIVPRAESIDDRELARVLIAANQCGARLLLGHDQSRKTGIVCRHLAVYAADKLATWGDELMPSTSRGRIERLLRCGFIRPAVEAMAESDMLLFAGRNDDPNDPSLFIVCDDARHIASVGQAVRESRVANGIYSAPVRLEQIGGSIELSVGEWIVTTQSDYAEPRLISGQFAKITEIDSGRNTLKIDLVEGGTRWIDPTEYPSIRPAAAISIREARGIHPDARLSVQLTDPRCAWSTLLLATTHGANARLFVDPKIAKTWKELVRVAQQSLPGILPQRLIPLRDQHAKVATLLSSMRQNLQEAESIPEPSPLENPAPRLLNISERVRDLLQSDKNVRLGYQMLYRYVGPDNIDRRANAARILSLCSTDLTCTIVRFLGETEVLPDQKPEDELNNAFDLLPEIATHAPRQWSEIDIYKFRLDLGSMSIPQSKWISGSRSQTANKGKGNMSHSVTRPDATANEGIKPPLPRFVV